MVRAHVQLLADWLGLVNQNSLSFLEALTVEGFDENEIVGRLDNFLHFLFLLFRLLEFATNNYLLSVELYLRLKLSILTLTDCFLNAAPGELIALQHVVSLPNLIAEVLTKDFDCAVDHVSVVLTGGLNFKLAEFTQHRHRTTLYHQKLDRWDVALFELPIYPPKDQIFWIRFLLNE